MKRSATQLLNLAKQLKTQEIYKHAKVLLNNFADQYSSFEASAWAELRKEALQFQVDGTVGDYMTLEIGGKYATAADLATEVLTNSTAMMSYRADVIKKRQQAIATISAMITVEAVDGFDIFQAFQ